MTDGNLILEERDVQTEHLTFEDGILFCKYIYQCAIHKTLNGLPEEWDIFYKSHEALERLDKDIKSDRLDEVLYKLNMDDVYTKM
jgi:hypothetical protein